MLNPGQAVGECLIKFCAEGAGEYELNILVRTAKRKEGNEIWSNNMYGAIFQQIIGSPLCVKVKPLPEQTLVAIAGSDSASNLLKTVESFNCKQSVSQKWQAFPPLPDKRRHHAACCTSGRIVVIGGHDGTTWLDSCVSLDAKCLPFQWNQLPALGTPRSSLAACVSGRFVYALGGVGSTGRLKSAEVICLDIDDAWAPLPQMLHVRARFENVSKIGNLLDMVLLLLVTRLLLLADTTDQTFYPAQNLCQYVIRMVELQHGIIYDR